MNNKKPNYAKIEVTMSYNFEDLFIYEAGDDKKKPYIVPDPNYKPIAFGWITQEQAAIETKARQMNGLIDLGFRVEESIDILLGEYEMKDKK